MAVHVSFNLDGVNRKLSSANIRRGRLAMANDAQQAMEQYVPKKEGHLRADSIVKDNGTVTYTVPYARAQFYGFIRSSRIHNYTTPGTSRRWDLRLKGNTSAMAMVKQSFLKGAMFEKR